MKRTNVRAFSALSTTGPLGRGVAEIKRTFVLFSAAAGVVWGVAGAAAPAAADPLDAFGLGGAAVGQAGARTATAVGPEAAHHQPAGVALGKEPALTVGWSFGWMRLRLDGRDADVTDVRGTSIALAVPVAVDRDWRLGVGLAMFLPDQYLARVRFAPIAEPRYVLLEDVSRIVVEPVAAIAYQEKLALGAGASMLADARGRKIVFDVGIVAGQKVGEAELDVELPPRFAPLVGLWLRPHRRVRGAVTYRGELALDVALDILANVEVAGVVTGDALVALRATSYFTPARLTGALAIEVAQGLTIDADVTWSRWSAYPRPPALDVLVALDLTPPLVSTDAPSPGFTDTVTARLGVEHVHARGPTDVAIRAGAAFVPSPVPPQPGLTSYADGDRIVIAAGAGLRLADGAPILTRPIDLDLGLQWQHVADRLERKQLDRFPGQAFSSGGNLLHVTLTSTVRF